MNRTMTVEFKRIVRIREDKPRYILTRKETIKFLPGAEIPLE